ncbi:MAG: hypothetical protein K8T90_00300 [Planctomycetes bacterium]|nr:hypothetical protein [Planctomycetota bacterium]
MNSRATRQLSHRPASTMLVILAAAIAAVALPDAPRTARADDAVPGGVAPVPEDRLILKDGRSLGGRVIAETPDAITFRSGSSTRMYPMADVDRLERAPLGQPAAPGPAGSADAGVPSNPPAGSGSGSGADAPPTTAQPPAAPEKKNTFGKKGKVLSDAARAWVRELAARAETADEQVRRSIAAGLRAFGPIAGPAILEGAANATTPSARAFLESVAADLSGDRGDSRGRASKQSAAPPTSTPRDAEEPPAADGPNPPVAPGNPPVAPGNPPTSPADGMQQQPPATATPLEPGAAPGAPTAPPGAVPFGGAGKQGGRAGRALLDRIVAELELRADQLPQMEQLMGTIERGQFALLRELRQGALAPDQVAARIETLRTTSRESAKGFLDAAQFDLFEEQTQRYFDGLQMRASRGELKPGKDAKAGPGGEAPK